MGFHRNDEDGTLGHRKILNPEHCATSSCLQEEKERNAAASRDELVTGMFFSHKCCELFPGQQRAKAGMPAMGLHQLFAAVSNCTKRGTSGERSSSRYTTWISDMALVSASGT